MEVILFNLALSFLYIAYKQKFAFIGRHVGSN